MGLLEKEPELLAINQDIIRNEGSYKTLTRESPVPSQNRSLERSYAFKKRKNALSDAIFFSSTEVESSQILHENNSQAIWKSNADPSCLVSF